MKSGRDSPKPILFSTFAVANAKFSSVSRFNSFGIMASNIVENGGNRLA